ncbi:Flp pilus assembly protein TadD, contains TPR repeats [Formosa sp. Hel1_31_208]|uniref:tetratricopeptide repeat protein n=1 Tax=Formosa sp. Hel1_31_208 TaxID=1798225 RepID=UPI00087BA5A2|nr:tetratricopeptide repeat protein [Formosa sp. Hel1_31_208]SDS62612.1 Flp pilus assembly protein TadD, contains TPR repeats [Formosa sp. Hel1_31_208]
MKKQIVVALALLVGTVSFSQKKELKTAEKAIKTGNFADAKSALQSAESLMGAADDKSKAKYHFLMGQALYANGTASNADIDKAIESFDMVGTIEGGSGKYSGQIEDLKSQMLNNFLTKANASLTSKDYLKSSADFEKAYRMSPKDTLYLYYAASTAVTAQDYNTSLKYYEELRDLGFEGIAIQYTATNKETGEIDPFDTKSLRDYSVRAGTHIAPKDKKTDSKAAEIVKNIALIHVANGNDEKAVEAMKLAREKNPDDLGLLLSEANVQLKMGNTDRFKDLMQEATAKDPNNAELQYNLGVISAESGDSESAMAYYEKAIELDPSYTDAYNNMAVLLLSTEKDLVAEMNSLGTSKADNKRYDELKAQRTSIYESAIPYLETTLKLKPKDIQAAQTLMNIYSAIGETDKFKAMKAKVAELEAGN